MLQDKTSLRHENATVYTTALSQEKEHFLLRLMTSVSVTGNVIALASDSTQLTPHRESPQQKKWTDCEITSFRTYIDSNGRRFQYTR